MLISVLYIALMAVGVYFAIGLGVGLIGVLQYIFLEEEVAREILKDMKSGLEASLKRELSGIRKIQPYLIFFLMCLSAGAIIALQWPHVLYKMLRD